MSDVRATTGNRLATDHRVASSRSARSSHAARPGSSSLIDWREPESNAGVLDWRRRAHEFGLRGRRRRRPLGRDTASSRRIGCCSRRTSRPSTISTIEDAEGDDPNREELDRPVEAGVSGDELDLVRVYLNHVGKRKLLKAREEQELGLRSRPRARGAGRARSASLRGQTLVSLADHVRAGTSPAAELILLPDGGELSPENVARSSRRSQHPADRPDSTRAARKCADRRSSKSARAAFRRSIDEGHAELGEAAAQLPLRPSLIDQIVAELREVDRASTRSTTLPSAERTAARRALEDRVCLPRPRFCQAFARDARTRRRCSKPSASCSRPTCGWSSRSRSAT